MNYAVKYPCIIEVGRPAWIVIAFVQGKKHQSSVDLVGHILTHKGYTIRVALVDYIKSKIMPHQFRIQRGDELTRAKTLSADSSQPPSDKRRKTTETKDAEEEL